MSKFLRFFIAIVLLLLTFAAFVMAIELRWHALLFFYQKLNVWQSVLLYLPSASFYLGLAGWFAVMTLPIFAKSLLKHLLLTVFMLLVLGFDGLFSAILKAIGDGMSLFSLYYLLTQFKFISVTFTTFFTAFYVIFLGGFLMFSLIRLRDIWLLRQRKQGLGLLLSLLLLTLSFVSFSEYAPRSANLSAIAYAFSSADKTPQIQDFEAKNPIHAAPGFSRSDIIEDKPSVVIITMESTRKDALSFYNNELKRSTKFFDALAKNSLVFNNMYATVPFTIKALTSINCGIYPFLSYSILESVYGLPSTCLGHWLAENGYSNVFIQSATVDYGNMPLLTKHWGIDTLFSAEDFDGSGLKSNVFGYQDEIMLTKSEQWLNEVEQPFFANYLTLGPHWPYDFYDKNRYFDYVGDDKKEYLYNFGMQFNRYLNTVYHLDGFLEQLFQQFKDSGHYESTIFIFIADHGESFGEHWHYQHGNNVYQESINIPFMIHAPKYLKQQGLSDALLDQRDTAQIISNVLGNKPVLDGIDNKRIFSACWFWQWCIARVDQHYKYIHNFDDAKDELYDLQRDPHEKNNIIDQHAELSRQFKQESVAWYREQLAIYAQYYKKQDTQFYQRGHPRLDGTAAPWVE